MWFLSMYPFIVSLFFSHKLASLVWWHWRKVFWRLMKISRQRMKKARVNKYSSYRLKILIIQDFWARKLVWHVLEIKFQSFPFVPSLPLSYSISRHLNIAQPLFFWWTHTLTYTLGMVCSCCLYLLSVATKNLFWVFWLNFIIKFVKLLVICADVVVVIISYSSLVAAVGGDGVVLHARMKRLAAKLYKLMKSLKTVYRDEKAARSRLWKDAVVARTNENL